MSTKSKSKPFKACRSCRSLVDRDVQVCPVCGSKEFSDEWDGVIIIINPDSSEIAKTMEIKNRGRFVVKLE
ncbi:MAG: transcription elongation factor subunit Spt4 [Desulfurococcaceae archaeon]